MENRDKYAEVYWTTEDLNKFDIPENQKSMVMELLEERLQDAMIPAGWEVIYEYMAANKYKLREEVEKN